MGILVQAATHLESDSLSQYYPSTSSVLTTTHASDALLALAPACLSLIYVYLTQFLKNRSVFEGAYAFTSHGGGGGGGGSDDAAADTAAGSLGSLGKESLDKRSSEVGSEVGSDLGSEVGSEVGSDVGSEVGSEVGVDSSRLGSLDSATAAAGTNPRQSAPPLP